MVKRFFDIVVSLCALFVLAPVMLAVAVAVKTDSSGPVFFRQIRVGLGGRDFEIMKFRSMSHDPVASQGVFDAGNSSRVTAVGQVIRKTKLDELPQFVNVLKGDMSIVGPRPEVRKWVEAYPERWSKVHCVRPGITDPAAIEFKDEEALLAGYDDPVEAYRTVILPRKLDLYEMYIDKRSLFSDVGVMLKTFTKIVRG
ncbi:sugar transferase [uncultured Alcanivorax sp.]|uniref:sugar transferase n=1 Tax=uncultured Alcanivorax sp. TaxID=191215 RepID=UPI002633AB9B|nr:sugar transferase [uncultured Alcanivorax sp.]